MLCRPPADNEAIRLPRPRVVSRSTQWRRGSGAAVDDPPIGLGTRLVLIHSKPESRRAMDQSSFLSSAVIKGAVGFGCALLLGLPISARSQTVTPGLDPQKPIAQYVHDVWQIDQGLPQNSVMAMAQTRDGYLWVGTEGGGDPVRWGSVHRL